MRPMRVTKASRPALLALNVGPWHGTWTANVFEDFHVRGCRSSTSRSSLRQHLQSRSRKRWVFTAGGPPTLSKFISLSQFSGVVQYSSGSSGRSSGGRRKDPSLLYGAGWEGGGEDVPVAVWWDFENCNVPQSIEVYKVGVNIVSGLRLSGFKGPVSISAYGDTVQLSRTTQEALASTGIRLHHVPSGGKDSSDRALLVDLILWTFDHPPPAHLFLISGDRDFSNALHRLRMRNYNILLACPPGTTVSPALLGAATHVWQWNSLVRGDGLLHAISPDGSSGGGSYSRHGGLRSYAPSHFHVSRSYDGNGHSSEGVGMPGPQVHSRTAEGNSVPPFRKPDTAPVSPSQSSEKQISNDIVQASVASDDGVAESPKTKPVVRQPPEKVLQQFRCLLTSHPNGMMLADLQSYISRGKLNFEKDYYGHGKIVPFLSSIPEIVQLERVLMKDNKSWSYNLFLSQETLKRSQGSEESHTAEEVSVQTALSRQEGERIPTALLTSSQTSSQTEVECRSPESQVKHGKIDSPPSSLLESVDQGEKNFIKEPHTAEELSVQTGLSRQERERTPAAPLTSSQASSNTEVECRSPESQVKHGKIDLPPSSLLESVDQGEEKIITDGFPPADQSAAQILEEKSSKYSQVDGESIDLGKNHQEGKLQADGLSSESEANQKSSNLLGKRTAGLTFVGSFVDALRAWQSKRTGVEHPSLPQQEYAKLNEKEGDVEQVKNHEVRSSSTECAGVQNQLEHSSTSSEAGRGEVEVVSPGSAKGVTEAGSEDRSGGVSREESSEVLSASKQLLSQDIYQGSGNVASDGFSARQVNNLDHESRQRGGRRYTSDELSRVIERDTRPTWKRWLFGPTSEEALSTSGMDLKASSEVNQVSESDVATPSLGHKQAEVDSELPEDSLSPSGNTKPTSVSARTGSIDNGDEKLWWDHSFVIRQESVNDTTHTMKVTEELVEYVNSAEATLLLSDAPDLKEAVNLIRTEGPVQFRSLDSHQISAVVGPLAKAKGIRWECFEDADSFGCSGSDSNKRSEQMLGTGPVGSLRGDAAQNHTETTDVVDFESEYQGKEIRTGDGLTRQTKEKTQENAREKPTLEAGDQTSSQEAFAGQTPSSNMVSSTHVDRGYSSSLTSEGNSGSWQQHSEASNSHPTSTTLTHGTKPVHPSFGEFEEWFLSLVNSAFKFKRTARIETIGYDLSLVKPDFEKEFGVRLDPRVYGFSRVQDLVASIPTVRLSKPRVDQCTIHLMKVAAEVQQANRYPDEQVEGKSGSSDTNSQYWPKMYHDCKALVRELMLKNPEGVCGSALKPLFASRFNYPLDHKRVGYQRMSDLLRLMPEVVSVSGIFLVPSKEFVKSLREEARAAKRVIENVELNADSDELRNEERIPEAGSQKGENWSEIDKEANGSSYNEEIDVELPGDRRLFSDQQTYGPRGLKNLSLRGEILDDFCLSSGDESDSLDSQADEFLSYDEDLHQKGLRRTRLTHTSEEKETIGSTRSLGPKDYDFSDEIDELLLEDNHIEKWLEENRQDTNREGVDPESEDVEKDPQLDLDGQLHGDWAAQLLKDHVQDSIQLPNDDHTTYSNGSGVYQGEEPLETVEARGEGQTSVTSFASEKHEHFDGDTSTSVSGLSSKEELAGVTVNFDEQRQEEDDSKSVEVMSRLQGKEVPSRLSEESCQVNKSRVDSIGESVVTATELSVRASMSDSSPRNVNVSCYTSSAETASPVEDSIHEPHAQDITAAEDAGDRNKSDNSVQQVQEEDNTGGSNSRGVATKRSVWGRLFK